MEIKVNLTRLIYNILVENIEARDNWMLTIKEVHSVEMKIKGITKNEYYEHFFNDELSNVESIKRMWAKIQEEIPTLRGINWEKRQRQGGQYFVDVLEIQTNQMKLFSADELNTFDLFNKQ